MMNTSMLYIYLMSKEQRLIEEYNQLRDNTWYRKPDELDLLEQIIHKVRLDTFNEINKELSYILCSISP